MSVGYLESLLLGLVQDYGAFDVSFWFLEACETLANDSLFSYVLFLLLLAGKDRLQQGILVEGS